MNRLRLDEPGELERCDLFRVGITVLLIGLLQTACGVCRMLPLYRAMTDRFPVRHLFTNEQTLALGLGLLLAGAAMTAWGAGRDRRGR